MSFFGRLFGRASGPEIPRIRKDVSELTCDDLNAYPIWEYAIDEEGVEGQDEATVRPRPDLQSADPAEGLFIVRIALVSADGQEWTGYCTPGETSEIDEIAPCILIDKGAVDFVHGPVTGKPSPNQLSDMYDMLNVTQDKLFPVRLSSAVAIGPAHLEADIPAFLYVDGDKKEWLK